MSDAFFQLPTAPVEDDSAERLAEYVRYIEKDSKGRWLTFVHPKAGKVAGRCLKAKYRGFLQPGNLIDFTLTIEGRSKIRRNTIKVSMVDSRARFRDSKQHAIDECKNHE